MALIHQSIEYEQLRDCVSPESAIFNTSLASTADDARVHFDGTEVIKNNKETESDNEETDSESDKMVTSSQESLVYNFS